MTEKRPVKISFCPSAPSKNLPFPPSANITAVELLAFLPHCLRSPSVVYRLTSNGGTRAAICNIVNAHRKLPRPWSGNSCGPILYETMRAAGFEGWTMRTHMEWHHANRENWDGYDISVSGFHLPYESGGGGSMASPIPFSQLAHEVRLFPDGRDGLDLTRMVQHAVEHPREDWMYPTDYDKLLRAIGGPAKVTREHTDAFCFKRWVNATVPPPSPSLSHEIPAPSTGKSLPKSSPECTLAGDAFWEAYENQTLEWAEDVLPEDAFHQYVRRQPEFVPPPTNEHGHPSVRDLNSIFKLEGKWNESDKFSPYAFGGPRTSAPYRPLHCIHPPDSNDISAWAENLRWAAEQVREFPAVKAWNESPEHMNIICAHRIQQEWVSDEWLNYRIQREEDRKKQTRKGEPGRLEKWRIDLQPVAQTLPMSTEALADRGLHNLPSATDRFFESGAIELPDTFSEQSRTPPSMTIMFDSLPKRA